MQYKLNTQENHTGFKLYGKNKLCFYLPVLNRLVTYRKREKMTLDSVPSKPFIRGQRTGQRMQEKSS